MFPRAQLSGVKIVSWKGQRSRTQDVKPPVAAVMFTYRRQRWRIKQQALIAHLAYAIVRPTLLSI